MKKIMMTLAAAVLAVSASAQVYVGGSLGIASTKVSGESGTTYQVLPEIGYSFDKNWALGTVIGWGKGTPVNIENADALRGYFTVQPYVRYTPVKTKYVNVFVDGGFGYAHFNGSANEWEVGLKPGLAVNLNDKISFVTHIGFLGYRTYKGTAEHAQRASSWGVNLDGNDVTFGVYYNF